MKFEPVTTHELSNIFNISERQVQRLVAQGVIEPMNDGAKPYRFALDTVTSQYIEHLESIIQAREGRDRLETLKQDKLRAEVEIKQAKAKTAQMELKELQGKLHRAEDVEAITTDMVLQLRSMLLSLPGRLAVDLSGTHTAPEQAERVKQEVYHILTTMANYQYDPDEYKKRLSARYEEDDSEDL